MASEAEIIKAAFASAMKDANSSMTRKQMANILKTLDAGLTDDGINNLFDCVDKNGNGVIEYGEFVDFICELEGDAGEPEKRAELNKSKTFTAEQGGKIFDMSRWKRALEGGAWAFACDAQASAMRTIVKQFPDLDPVSPEGLTLAEEFILMWHDKETKQLSEYSYFGADEPFHNALFGACLLGLQARKCLTFVPKKCAWLGYTFEIKLTGTGPDDSKVLRATFDELKSNPTNTLKMWFEEKSGKWGQDETSKLAIQSLVDRGVFKQGTLGDAFNNATFEVVDNSYEVKLVKRLRGVCDGTIEPDGRSVALLALCRTADVRDTSTNLLMKQIFGADVEAMTAKVDALVEEFVTFNGIGNEEINKMIDALPGELQQTLASKEFKDDAAAQFKTFCDPGKNTINPASLSKKMDQVIKSLVTEKLGIQKSGLESVIRMFDRNQDGDLELEGFQSFLMWCYALEALA